MGRLTAIWISLAVLGCTATLSNKQELVRQRAAFDLNCEDAVNVVHLSNKNVFGATGCGRRASYIVECKNPDIVSCTAVMNSNTSDASNTVATPPESKPAE